MKEFAHFSDTDESAVDELISQAEDLCVLEQVSELNACGSTHSLLPTHLETRFRNLKSLSLPKTQPQAAAAKTGDPAQLLSPNKEYPQGKLGLDKDTPVDGYASSPSNSSNSSTLSFEEGNPHGKKGLKKKSQLKSPSGSPNSGAKHKSGNTPTSPPHPSPQSGCFWCFPSRVSEKKSKETWSSDWGSRDDELLKDFGIFSVKEQQKMMRKAMKEEEKINQEAEKIVNWAKQASARMSFHGIEDELSLSDDQTAK